MSLFLADYNSIGKPTEVAGQGSGDVVNDVINIVNVVIGVLGVVAVIVIIFGGVQYMTSAGDAGKVKKGKDTILYGIVGLVICILAAAIVNFVIVGLTGNQQQTGGGSGQTVPLGRCVHGQVVESSVTESYCDGIHGYWSAN